MKQNNSAIIFGLGMMGRRHLLGLVRAGFDVVTVPFKSLKDFDIARQELHKAGLDSEKLRLIDVPTGSYGAAVFCETTPGRLTNFTRFLQGASAGRILLEKPLSADPAEFDQFLNLAHAHGVADITQVNLIRRTWPHVQRLADMCKLEKQFTMTLNGGAIGLGCMGIHYLDTFLYLSGNEIPITRWARLSAEMVKSGRGINFEDFGGDFVLEGSRGLLLASLSAGSSANVMMTVRGEHFMAQVDYSEMQWRILCRKASSRMPLYRYGSDYEIVEQGRVEIPAMDVITESWALGRIALPLLEQALSAHRLLDEILRFGGAHPPYQFT
jgi:predicted dehydrogenase